MIITWRRAWRGSEAWTGTARSCPGPSSARTGPDSDCNCKSWIEISSCYTRSSNKILQRVYPSLIRPHLLISKRTLGEERFCQYNKLSQSAWSVRRNFQRHFNYSIANFSHILPSFPIEEFSSDSDFLQSWIFPPPAVALALLELGLAADGVAEPGHALQALVGWRDDEVNIPEIKMILYYVQDLC